MEDVLLRVVRMAPFHGCLPQRVRPFSTDSAPRSSIRESFPERGIASDLSGVGDDGAEAAWYWRQHGQEREGSTHERR